MMLYLLGKLSRADLNAVSPYDLVLVQLKHLLLSFVYLSIQRHRVVRFVDLQISPGLLVGNLDEGFAQLSGKTHHQK